MCQHQHPHHRHSIFCILPPYLLREITQRGSAAQRAAANRTLASDRNIPRASRQPDRAGAAGDPAPARPWSATRQTADDLHSRQQGNTARHGHPRRREPGRRMMRRLTRHMTVSAIPSIFTRKSSAAIPSMTRACRSTPRFITGTEYNNAFWNGERMVFGDGDGELFNRFTIALDVIGHELAHGVTEDESGLVYMFQPGALNEHLSDVFGSLVKQKVLNQTADQADWLIGAGLLANSVNGEALRSMKAARDGIRRPGARQRSAARPYEQLRAKPGRTTEAFISTPAFPTKPFISRPRRSAAMPGKKPAGSGTRRCAIRA